MMIRQYVEQLETRDTPAAFSGAGFATDYHAEYGFVGELRNAFGHTPGFDWHAVAGGTGNGPRVVVTDVRSGALLADFFAFEGTFRGGVELEAVQLPASAGGDRLLVAAGPGGAPIVHQYDPTLGLRVGPTLVFGDVDRDRMGIDYLNASGGQVYAMLGEGAGPRLFGADPLTGALTESVFIGPEADRSGEYRPAPAGLGVRGPGDNSDPYLLGVYVDGPDDDRAEWYALPNMRSAI